MKAQCFPSRIKVLSAPSEMKLILALLFSGVAYSISSPTCSQEELDKCFKYDPRVEDEAFRATEEHLDYQCEQFGCSVDYQKKCGLPDVPPGMIPMYKQYGKIYDAVCEKNTPMRRKFLENSKCLDGQTGSMNRKCKAKDQLDNQDPHFCEGVADYLTCTTNFIREECGEDASEVYTAVSPGLDFYGCSN